MNVLPERRGRRCLLCIWLLLLATGMLGGFAPRLLVAEGGNSDTGGGDPAAQGFEADVGRFLKKYCIACHGPDDPSGERRFDTLDGRIANDNAVVDYQEMLDQLNLSEMPPEDAEQPAEAERLQAIDWLTKRVAKFHEARVAQRPEVVLRRLNAREYRNTIRDLMGLNLSMFDPAESFPRERTAEHLDNVGQSLVTSGFLMGQYLESAERIVEKALLPTERPEKQSWKFVDDFHQQPEIDQVHRKTNGYEWLTLYDVVGADKHEGAYAPIHAFAEGVPEDGFYAIRFQAEALNREHPYEDAFLGRDREEPLRLGIVAGNQSAGTLHLPQPVEPLLAELDLADEPKWYAVRVWLDRGFTPRFTFRNGLMDARNLWSRIQKRYPDQFPKLKSKGIVEARFNAIAHGALPQIRIDAVEIEGPFYDEWPTQARQRLLGPQGDSDLLAESSVALRRQLARFMTRAYRRPVESEEVDRIEALISRQRSRRKSFVEAYGDGLKAVLCSPKFLYLDEGRQDKISQWALASRLSYFLWSSMPDEALFEAAANGRLASPQNVREQVQRMLKDPKSSAFVNDFLDSWLNLRDLGATPPDRGSFRAYYQYDLQDAMLQETRLFTRYLLDNNLSIRNFLDSDFTFVNKRLAAHYGIDVPESIRLDAGKFCRVSLTDRRRGGLLGQASVLTVTANGIDTSPVVRGVWMLENVLGTPPSPPPPDVEPLDPDVRGAKSIREQLEKHRDVPSCYECHRRIDPLGFALENFDPIGRWRETYSKRVPVRAAGKLPNGREFKDIGELKRLLAAQESLFARSLTQKLLSYASGRLLGPSDRPQVDRIVERLQQRQGGFRDLILLVATSDLFRNR